MFRQISNLVVLIFILQGCKEPKKSVEDYQHLLEISWVSEDMDTCMKIVMEYSKEYKEDAKSPRAFCEELFKNYEEEFKLFKLKFFQENRHKLL
ncbi:hypothetical protein OQH61_05010 [Helicobacter sp. MIT 21-1697]|uniref:hypothetical protein n=1 Tax=Helicobacter sp. MIT 21-1697 TaxID=2993733 RepID=UPI00224A6E83|nr:hypothetical protein [Helicobacter sp. MIT 21-1697]MCX2717092.1 hypothetical protein [Helicobacter sp. MIT 21-1697]